jgi:hypothetical protein
VNSSSACGGCTRRAVACGIYRAYPLYPDCAPCVRSACSHAFTLRIPMWQFSCVHGDDAPTCTTCTPGMASTTRATTTASRRAPPAWTLRTACSRRWCRSAARPAPTPAGENSRTCHSCYSCVTSCQSTFTARVVVHHLDCSQAAASCGLPPFCPLCTPCDQRCC